MDKLFDETFGNEGDEKVSRNIWYGYADITIDGDFGKVLKLDENIIIELSQIIKNNLTEEVSKKPTETNWYFYGSTHSRDAVGDDIRPSIMVREKNGSYAVNVNFSDYDFAVNLDHIMKFQNEFHNHLENMHI